jgi:PDZ domain-containing protein
MKKLFRGLDWILLIASTARRRIRPDLLIAALLLLIPAGVATFCFLPRYSSFYAPGEIVSVQELGVNGSVRFCYVREGVTRNLYERWSVQRAYPGTQFTAIDRSSLDELEDTKELGALLRDETIRNALVNADELAAEPHEETQTDMRLAELIAEAEEYYGDSLGLMLAIGLVEEARQEDLSGGGRYVISGTGTMEADHTVGSVGAIREKLQTAGRYGADYFLIPGDRDRFYYEGLSNEEEAQLAVKELGLSLKLVPVDSLEEALDFLRNLN